MQQQNTPEETYKNRTYHLYSLLKKLKRKRNYFGWLRLCIVIATLLFIYHLFVNSSVLVWLIVGAGIAVFLYIISIDTNNNNEIADAERLLAINNEELSIINGNYDNRDDGLSFLPAEHPYAMDIDLFGRSSIYQYINRCTSAQSKHLLASLLLSPSQKDIIQERQQAAKKLAPFVEWRQQLQSAGLANPLTMETEEKIMRWLKSPDPLQKTFWRMIPGIFTALTLTCLAAYLLDWLPSSISTFLLFLFFFFAKYTSSKVNKVYLSLSKVEAEADTIYKQLKLAENAPSAAPLLESYKKLLVAQRHGSESIKELKQIFKRFDFRLNVLIFIILNTFLLWDIRQANSLNKWKKKNALFVPQWFTILANTEVINTLATLTFNHPGWIFPTINNEHFTLSAQEMGHPLINSKSRVSSSFSTQGTGKISIITGSNMAGKSTFLRSIAVNLVLAQMGSPVCATAFTCSSVYLCSSMRIADNLAENTSTFYAELKKLKNIIDKVKNHEKVFILLDEILRGTNSLDRHTGSEALIKQLIKEHAVAVIATHDVELASLANEYITAITNYYFDAQVEGEELYFDYKLKLGICKSMNASILMKKIGIEI